MNKVWLVTGSASGLGPQLRGRGNGHKPSQRRCSIVPRSRRYRLDHCQSSACSARLAHKALRSTCRTA